MSANLMSVVTTQQPHRGRELEHRVRLDFREIKNGVGLDSSHELYGGLTAMAISSENGVGLH